MDGNQYKKGQHVVYGTNGICIVEDVKEMQFAAGMEKNIYYILKPANANASTIFVPVKNEVLVSRMRRLMTKEEIDALLLGIRNKAFQWESDRRVRGENFHEILMNGVTEELLLMIGCIYVKKAELLNQNRKLPTTDTNTLKSAEKLVEEEFAYVLGIEPQDVGRYIRRLLNVPELQDD